MSITRYKIPDRLAAYINPKDSSDIYMVMSADFDACAKAAVEMARAVLKSRDPRGVRSCFFEETEAEEAKRSKVYTDAQAIIYQYGGTP